MINNPTQPPPGAADPLDSIHLAPEAARALLRLVESAPEVRRRYQFFMWLQAQVQPLLPHTVALCGAYHRQRRQLQFEIFNTVVLPPMLTLQLSGSDSPLLQRLVADWVDGEGQPLLTPLASLARDSAGPEAEALRAAGVERVLVHGVSRPDRLHEVAGLFVLGGRAGSGDGELAHLFDLVVHALHAAYLRTLSFERELGPAPVRAPLPATPLPSRMPRVTPREAQILAWVREGKNNQEIGIELGISALTVKNHIQKILRKLGASNRAHAVALAMQSRLLPGDGPMGSA
jgi:transcriptional regulator EpsA